MLFNSFDFALFLPCVFLVYWGLLHGRRRLQNLFLVVVSYIFYGWWDWRFLTLIFASSLLDYACGLCIYATRNQARRRFFLVASLVGNLGVLGFFKYYNFFVDNIADAVSLWGLQLRLGVLKIILPVGISFYTFQTLSYTLDIYRRQLPATRDIVEFFAFVSFFPQLVAGPIERAAHLLPQFARDRRFDYARAAEGMKLILWGLFKKMAIADACAESVDYIFTHHASLNGITLWIGVLYFSFQIYCDFSGYSDIARGTAWLFGFDLMWNFRMPYFSRDMREFWQRWHISLSTWFRDYVYIPLGGNRCGRARHAGNLLATFCLSGFWHGANWTFVIWGLTHGLFQIPRLFRSPRPQAVAFGPLASRARTLGRIAATFALACLPWVLFRSRDLCAAAAYYAGMFTRCSWSQPVFPAGVDNRLAIISVFAAWEWGQRNALHPLHFERLPRAGMWLLCLALTLWLLNSLAKQQSFIYFQF